MVLCLRGRELLLWKDLCSRLGQWARCCGCCCARALGVDDTRYQWYQLRNDDRTSHIFHLYNNAAGRGDLAQLRSEHYRHRTWHRSRRGLAYHVRRHRRPFRPTQRQKRRAAAYKDVATVCRDGIFLHRDPQRSTRRVGCIPIPAGAAGLVVVRGLSGLRPDVGNLALQLHSVVGGLGEIGHRLLKS